MIKLITANGIEFEISWIGVASIDGVLRFGVINSTLSEVINTFTNPENCTVLTRNYDGVIETFEGFTVFRGISINFKGEMIVALSKI